MSALACCVPWVTISLLRRRDATVVALKDPMLSFAAVLSGLGGAAFSGCYIYALDFTTLADAFVLTNTHSIILLLSATARDFSVAPLKLLGTVVSTAGAWLTTFDPRGPGQGSATVPHADVELFGSLIPSRLLGDCIAVTGALGGVLMLVVSKLQRSHMVLSVYTLLLTAAALAAFLVAARLFDAAPPALSFNSRHGVFGLLEPSHWLGAFVAGPVSSILGSVGYVAVLKYFDPLVMANVMLCDQIVGNFFFRLLFQEAPWPRLLTWVGTGVMATGVAAMVLAGRVKITHFNIRLRENP